MKKLIPIIVLFCMVIAFIPASFSDAEETDDGLWINGEKMTGSVTKDKWSYDATSNTLTLNGATLDQSYEFYDNETRFAFRYITSPIYDGRTDGVLKIVVYGDNVILPYIFKDFAMECGIFSMNSIEISGTGSLRIYTENGTDEYYAGFVVDKHITIDGATTTIENTGSGCDLEIHNLSEDATASLTMKKGTLNLLGEGSLDMYGSMFVRGGTINSVDSSGYAFLIQDLPMKSDGVFDMTGGIINFTNPTADMTLIESFSRPGGSEDILNVHGATLNNVIQDGKKLKSVDAGPASIGTVPKEFKITVDANEGVCIVPSVLTEDNGALASLPEATKDGYKLDGWFTEKEGGEEITTSTVFTKDTTIYAHWSEKKSGGSNLGLYIGIGIGVVALAAIVIAGTMFFIKKK